MPELPDVEGFRRILQSHVVGQRITSVEVRDPGVLRNRSKDEFIQQLEGRRFGEPARRGKWLWTKTDGPTLLFHFGMTGSLLWEGTQVDFDHFDRVSIAVGRGRLLFRDQRKLRGLWLTNGDNGLTELLGEQGPDALGLTGTSLEERLERKRGALKSALMDQRVLAGLGNMLSDEVLWRARIHPKRSFGDLDAQERLKLDRCLQQVLRASVKAGRIPRTNSWLSSQRSQANPLCPRCSNRLEINSIGGRTSYWCAVCQPPSG